MCASCWQSYSRSHFSVLMAICLITPWYTTRWARGTFVSLTATGRQKAPYWSQRASSVLRVPTRVILQSPTINFQVVSRCSSCHHQSSTSCTATTTTTTSIPDELLDECWSTTSWSINPSDDPNINKILQGLNSPAPHSLFCLQHALNVTNNWRRAFEACYHLVKFDYQIVVHHEVLDLLNHNDDSYQLIPGSDWKTVSVSSEVSEEEWIVVERPPDYRNTIQIVNQALTLVQEASERQEPVDECQVASIIQQAKEHMYLTLGTDIRGRTCADTAFTLALAGVTDDDGFYRQLSKLTCLELQRVGSRPSRRGKDILHIVEKLAASGVRNEHADRTYQIAAKCLEQKGPHLKSTDDLLNPGQFSLLSERPLIWLWRFSARLPKPKLNIVNAERDCATMTKWLNNFQDISRPLVLDLGCGMGVSLLGLASLPTGQGEDSPLLSSAVSWTDCNYLGVDLSHLAIRFAKGIATRWCLSDSLQFTVCSTEILLDQVVAQYPGPVSLILVQFPTPYRLEEHNDAGNSQLPSNVEEGFMISPRVMVQMAQILRASSGARILFQSNCEDVAVRLRDMAREAGLRCIKADNPVLEDLQRETDDSSRLPQRTERWIQQGGERAIGPEWWTDTLLPNKCLTETEVACGLKRTPVHRCLVEAEFS